MLLAMKRTAVFLNLCLFTMLLTAANPAPEKPGAPPTHSERGLDDYLRHETELISTRCLADVQSLADWQAGREESRRQLQEMLGLWPMPERTDLKPVVTGKLEHDEFTVEKLHFQASPHLYVAANLWLPKKLQKPAPAILYVCGHSRVVTNGVSCGNKTGYQHHGAWFARNGYVCLVIDTLQLGEIEGLHHGTYREGMWWWNARGYTPAGVEAWFGLRALDYLCSRPEVDKERIGMTGRSGGGSYSWTVAALDERVKIVAPIAGITDLQNQVVDGCVEGHCDCMFFVNTYRWDFPQVAALIAPRPLLLGNSDKDRIFPLDGVVRLHEKVRRIYRLYGAANKLGLLITEGPHEDTQDLQLPVFRWFNRWLKGEETLIEMAAKPLFTPEQLRVFEALPADQINTRIQETFVALGDQPLSQPTGGQPKELLATLRQKVFAGWPSENPPLDARRAFSSEHDGVRFSAWDFTSQHDVRLRLYVLENAAKPAEAIELEVLDGDGWLKWLATARAGFANELSEELADTAGALDTNSAGFGEWKRGSVAGGTVRVWFAPRGVGLSAWAGDEKKQTQIRRRFMLLGQTLDGMRVWDIRRAVGALRALPEFQTSPLAMRAAGSMGVNALYAGLFEPTIARLDLSSLPKSHRGGPDYLNVLRVLDIPEALELAGGRAQGSLRD